VTFSFYSHFGNDFSSYAFGWEKKLIARKGKTYKRILSPTFYICQKKEKAEL